MGCRQLGGAVDQQPRPQPSGAERVQLAAPAVADVRGRGVEALTPDRVEQTGQLRDEPSTDRIGFGQHPAEQVDDDPGPAGRLAMRGEDAQQAARA